MPKGQFTRPKGSKRKTLSDPTGKANEALRRAAASGDPKKYTSFPMSKKKFANEMRMRERGSGTAKNYGMVSNKGVNYDKSEPLVGGLKYRRRMKKVK